ncbi:MAG: electron transfer flavoprotein subunit alpha/FixB family protein [Clostridiaceae bacterium]|nr:electron transfer flavoprotein subunit alpha/FixB family protein [Clostridiaceae bacterium]
MTEGNVLIFAEQKDGAPVEVALQLVRKGRELAQKNRCGVYAVTAGPSSCLEALSAAGAEYVFWLRCDEWFPQDICAREISGLVKRIKPDIMLFGATALGRSLAPRVAVRLQTGLTADCTDLQIDNETGYLLQTRPTFGGDLIATIVCPERRPQMATVRPGVFPKPEQAYQGLAALEELVLSTEGACAELISWLSEETQDDITKAKILVVAGRGIGRKENMSLVKKLAKLLGGDYGVTRPLVDASWAEYPHQVGQTGRSVAPDLLISLGVSGAVQHLAGIGGAKKVVAVNADDQAPIFGSADVSIVSDCVAVMEEMIARLESRN